MFFIQFYTYLTYNFIFLSIHFLTYLKCYIYVDVLMYVPIVYGFLPEINVFVFVLLFISFFVVTLSSKTAKQLHCHLFVQLPFRLPCQQLLMFHNGCRFGFVQCSHTSATCVNRTQSLYRQWRNWRRKPTRGWPCWRKNSRRQPRTQRFV